jgi:hypothetical protein
LPLVLVLVGNQVRVWFRVRILVPAVVVVRFEILVPAMVEVHCEILVPAMVGVRCEILVRTFWSVRVLEGMELKIEEKRKFRSDQIRRVLCEAEPMLNEEENRKRKLFYFYF